MSTTQGPDGGMPAEAASQANRSILVLTGLALALALMFASLYPQPLMPAILSHALLAAALATAIVAVVLAQRPFAAHLNLWDKAMLLAFGGMLAGSFVDPEAVATFIEAYSPAPADDATLPAVEG